MKSVTSLTRYEMFQIHQTDANCKLKAFLKMKIEAATVVCMGGPTIGQQG